MSRLRSASFHSLLGCEVVKSDDKEIPRIRQISADQDLLHRTVQDTCQFAYGTKMVEVWVWNSALSKLFRPDGGWWIDPHWHSEGHATDGSCTFCKFVDKSPNDYIAPPALSPGVSIPGVLWTDLGHKNRKQKRRDSNPKRRDSNPGNGDGGFLLQALTEARHDQMERANERIAWRDAKALLAEDPHQPRTHRLQVIASTNLR